MLTKYKIMTKLRELSLLHLEESQVEQIGTILDSFGVTPEDCSSWDSGGGHEHFFAKLPSGFWLGFHSVTEDITLSFVPYVNDCKLYDDFWTQENITTGVFITEEGTGFEVDPKTISAEIDKHAERFDEILSLVNWSEVSFKLTGSRDNIRSSKIKRGDVPNKYRKQINALILKANDWREQIKEGD